MIGLLKWNTSYRLVSSRVKLSRLSSSFFFHHFRREHFTNDGSSSQLYHTYMSTSDNFYEEKGDSKSPGSLLDWRVWCVYPIHRFYKAERHEQSRDIGNDWFYYWHWLLGPVNWMYRTRGIPSRAQVFLHQTKINSDALWRTKWSDILDVNYTK